MLKILTDPLYALPIKKKSLKSPHPDIHDHLTYCKQWPLLLWLGAISLLLFIFSTDLQANPLVVIDAGHEPSKPGAIATCGIAEVVYNDAIVNTLLSVLSHYQIKLTRQRNAEVNTQNPRLTHYLSADALTKWPAHKTLYARAAIANAEHADMFLSFHHDSTLLNHQVDHAALCQGRGGKKLSEAFKKRYQIGFNIFVYDAHDSRYEASLKLAHLLGKRLLELGRIPADYHQDDCKSCRVIDAKLGIWHQDLAVLRLTTMPALLIEVGNLLDPDDEALISSPSFQNHFAEQVKMALDDYFNNPINSPLHTHVSP